MIPFSVDTSHIFGKQCINEGADTFHGTEKCGWIGWMGMFTQKKVYPLGKLKRQFRKGICNRNISSIVKLLAELTRNPTALISSAYSPITMRNTESTPSPSITLICY